MKKHSVILLIALFIVVFAGCGTKPEPDRNSSSAVYESETVGDTISEETEGSENSEEESNNSNDSASVKPVSYTWNPSVYNKAYIEYLGEDTEIMYHEMVSAILNREAGFACSMKYYEQLYPIISTCFPCAERIVSFGFLDVEDESVDFTDQQGTVSLEYLISEEEQNSILKEFGARVEDLICSSVCTGDSDTVSAIAVYNRFCQNLIYDYDAAEEDSQDDVSPYRAIMESSGICQSFAPAYAHLCVQLQIPACSTGGLNADNTQSHEWTQLKLDGIYYYADPTWQTDGGLNWFGFTSEYRETHDDYPASMQNIGELNLYRADEVPVGDDRFDELRNCIYNVEITREGNTLTIHANDESGLPVTVSIQ